MSNQKHPTPFQDRVIVSRSKPETKSPGGIIIPELSLVDNQSQGTVIAIGPTVGRKNPESKISANKSSDTYPKPGDFVEFGQHAGITVKYKGEEFLVMKEADILCKL